MAMAIGKSYYPVIGTIKDINEAERTLWVVMSTGGEDRDGDVVDMKGLNFDNYLANPVVLWAHDIKSPPIGQVLEIKHMGDEVWAHVQFDNTAKDLEIYHKYVKGFLRGWSMGFLKKDFDKRPGRRGIHVKSAEVVELSGATIPSNPKTLSLLQKTLAGMDEGEEAKQEFVTKLLSIDYAEKSVSLDEGDWSAVDKTTLPREAFAEQGDPDKKSTWGYPYKVLRDGKLVVSRAGLNAAWAAAQGARSGKKASPEVLAMLSAARKEAGLDEEPTKGEKALKTEDTPEALHPPMICPECGHEGDEEKCPKDGSVMMEKKCNDGGAEPPVVEDKPKGKKLPASAFKKTLEERGGKMFPLLVPGSLDQFTTKDSNKVYAMAEIDVKEVVPGKEVKVLKITFKEFNPDQERDEQGRWSGGGSTEQAAMNAEAHGGANAQSRAAYRAIVNKEEKQPFHGGYDQFKTEMANRGSVQTSIKENTERFLDKEGNIVGQWDAYNTRNTWVAGKSKTGAAANASAGKKMGRKFLEDYVTKEGRVLSGKNRGRLQSVLEQLGPLWDELEGLLAETQPAPKSEGIDPMHDLPAVTAKDASRILREAQAKALKLRARRIISE